MPHATERRPTDLTAEDDRVEITLQLSAGPDGSVTVHATSPEGPAEGRFVPPRAARGARRDEPGDRSTTRPVQSLDGPPASPAEEEDLRAVGGRLFEAVFADSGLFGLYESTRTAAARPLRLRVVVDPDGPGMDGVHALPWETLYDRDRGERLACEGKASIVRSLVVRRPPEPWEPAGRLRVLVLLSGARDLDLDGEAERLEELSKKEPGIAVERAAANDLDGLERLLQSAEDRNRPFHVLHFAGHGGLSAGPAGGVLVWEPPGLPRVTISGQDLSALLRRFLALQMVVLNACSTADLPGDGRDPFAGVAAALLQGGVPVVVGAQGKLRDDAALLFAETFYRSLARGAVPEDAVAAARWALWKKLPEGQTWAQPILFQATTERRFRTPTRWLRAAAVLTVALLLAVACSAWLWRNLQIRDLEQAVDAAQDDLARLHPETARQVLEQALARSVYPPPPAVLEAALHGTLAIADQDMGEAGDAVTHASKATALDPENASYQYNLGVLLARAGRPAEAIAPLRRALAIEPDHADAANELGCAYMDLARYADSRSVLTSAVTSHPEHGWLHKNLGRTLLALGEPAAAARHLERALDLLPWEARVPREEARLLLARAAAANGDTDRACKVLGGPQPASRETVSGFSEDAARLAQSLGCTYPSDGFTTGEAHAP